MNTDTGAMRPMANVDDEAEQKRVAAELGCELDRLVTLRGAPDAVADVGRRVRLGVAEDERRRARRKQQKQSRAANR